MGLVLGCKLVGPQRKAVGCDPGCSPNTQVFFFPLSLSVRAGQTWPGFHTLFWVLGSGEACTLLLEARCQLWSSTLLATIHHVTALRFGLFSHK